MATLPSTVLAPATLLLLGCILLSRYVSHSARNARKNQHPEDEPSLAPVVPYLLPGIAHGISFGWNPAEFVLDSIKRYGWVNPLRILAGPTVSFTVIANPGHAREVLRKSRVLHNKFNIIFTMVRLLGAPQKAMKFYWADDSGMSAAPRKGSRTEADDRIHYHQAHTSQKYLSGTHLTLLSEKFRSVLDRHLDEKQDIQDEWVSYPDLYSFLKHLVIRAGTEAVMGSAILEMTPNLIDDFIAFEKSYPYYFRLWPSWLVPRATRSRERLIDAITKWHSYALEHCDTSKVGPEDPEWEPIFGTKYMKARQNYWSKMKPVDARTRACEDLGLIFGLNANTMPCIFWYIFEALKDKTLQTRLNGEVASAFTDDGDMNVVKLTNQPLMQSVYAEVLRQRVDIFLTRMAAYDDVNFNRYTIPQGDHFLLYSGSSHFNPEAWTEAGRPPKVPLEEFDAERFLVYAENKKKPQEEGEKSSPPPSSPPQPRFSTTGLNGVWFPFGGGEHLCPGRLFAKAEILITYAALFSKFEVEMLLQDPSRVKSNRYYAPFGALPPTGPKVPFRIRRRQV